MHEIQTNVWKPNVSKPIRFFCCLKSIQQWVSEIQTWLVFGHGHLFRFINSPDFGHLERAQSILDTRKSLYNIHKRSSLTPFFGEVVWSFSKIWTLKLPVFGQFRILDARFHTHCAYMNGFQTLTVLFLWPLKKWKLTLAHIVCFCIWNLPSLRKPDNFQIVRQFRHDNRLCRRRKAIRECNGS